MVDVTLMAFNNVLDDDFDDLVCYRTRWCLVCIVNWLWDYKFDPVDFLYLYAVHLLIASLSDRLVHP